MSQWGKTDNAANSVNWGPSLVKKTSNTTNQTALFGNTTPDAFISGTTIGQYGVSSNEAVSTDGVVHAGWVLKKEGSGGRAGRVHYETLVAGGSITGDADGATIPDAVLKFTTQPTNQTGNSAANETVTFTALATATPAGPTVTYLWQYTTTPGDANTFATTAAVAGFSGQTTGNLSVNTAVIATGTLVRAVASATGTTSVNSNSATLTVTA